MENLIFESSYKSLDRFNDIELAYDLFLAENDMNAKMMNLNAEIIYEGMSYITEAKNIKEWIINLAKKFSEALQKAFTKIKIIFGEGKDLIYLKAIQNKVFNLKENPTFSVKNIRVYDNNKFASFKIKTFDEIDKNTLESEDKFLISNYPDLGFAEGNTKTIDVLNKHFVTINDQDTQCTIEYLKQIHQWCLKDYIKIIESLEINIKQYNQSNKNIENYVNQMNDAVVSNQTQNNTTQQQAAPGTATSPQPAASTQQQTHESTFFNSYINEDNTTNNQNQQNDKMEINDNPGAENNNGENNENKSNGVADQVKVFLKATTSILSALFIIVKNQKADYIKILKHQFPISKADKAAQNAVNANIISPNTQNTSSEIPDVN